MKSTHIKEILDELNSSQIIKKKRERAVFSNGTNFYKVWVEGWISGKIPKHCFETGFYNSSNTDSVFTLLHDDSGPRGYVQKAGVRLFPGGDNKSWGSRIDAAGRDIISKFLKDAMSLSIEKDGTFADFVPSNLILYNDKINFIDLESFRSFDFIFDGSPKHFENFDLNAWWKPLETAQRDVNKFFKSCFSDCLGIDLDFNIDSRENFERAYATLVERFPTGASL